MTKPVKLYTVPNVKIAKVGDYPVERGYGKFTEADIASMAEQAEAGMSGRLKIGHVETGPGALGVWGQTANHRVEVDEDGLLTLVADYVNVPGALAKELPTRLPGRSVEAVRNRKLGDGTIAPMVMTGVALLGDKEPAMSNLGDHPTVEGLHEVVTVGDAELAVSAARMLEDLTPEELAAGLVTSVDSAGEPTTSTTTEDAIVPDENPTPTPDEQPAPTPAAPAEAPAEAPATPAEGDETPAAPAAAELPDNVIPVDRAVWERMEARIAELETQAEETVAAGRDSYLDDAIHAGKFTDAERGTYADLLEKAPDSTRKLIDAMPSTIPVHAERGHAGAPDGQGVDADGFTPAERAAYDARYGSTNTTTEA